jgi:hypothetical protein
MDNIRGEAVIMCNVTTQASIDLTKPSGEKGTPMNQPPQASHN